MTSALGCARALSIASLLLPPIALAQGIDGPALYRQGVEAFQAGDAARARVLFRAAFASLGPGHALIAPTLYNLARSTQELGRACDAQEDFEEYLTVATSRADEASRVVKAHAGLDDVRAACIAATAAPSGAMPQEPGDGVARRGVEPVRAGEGWMTIAGWTAVGLGVAAAGAGAAFHVAAFDAHSEGEGLQTDDDPARERLNSRIDTDETLAITGYALGGTLLAAGALVLLWPDEGEGSSRMAVTFGPESLTLQGAW